MIENELKYVLSLDSYASLALVNSTIINQGYNKDGARVRKQDDIFTFNYKWLNDDIVEEFEMLISEKEFIRIYKNCIKKLNKIRFSQKDEYDNTWDIDFFIANNDIYFAMAECEMKDCFEDKPKDILPILKPFILYEVPRKDSSNYSSSKIADISYAEYLLDTINKG